MSRLHYNAKTVDNISPKIEFGDYANVFIRIGISEPTEPMVYGKIGKGYRKLKSLSGQELEEHIQSNNYGLGIEGLIAQHLSGRLEYMYTDYRPDVNLSYAGTGKVQNITAVNHSVRVGLAFIF